MRTPYAIRVLAQRPAGLSRGAHRQQHVAGVEGAALAKLHADVVAGQRDLGRGVLDVQGLQIIPGHHIRAVFSEQSHRGAAEGRREQRAVEPLSILQRLGIAQE